MQRTLLLLTLSLAIPAHSPWQIQTSNTTADLRGIHSIGNGVAWASGTNGTVLRTDDGKNWRPLLPNPAQHDPPMPTKTGTPSRYPSQ